MPKVKVDRVGKQEDLPESRTPDMPSMYTRVVRFDPCFGNIITLTVRTLSKPGAHINAFPFSSRNICQGCGMEEELTLVELSKGVLVRKLVNKGVHKISVSLMLSGHSKGRAAKNDSVGRTGTQLKARPYTKNEPYGLFTGDLSLLI